MPQSMAGRLPPGMPINFVIKLPILQMAKDTARAVADWSNGSLLPDSDFTSSSIHIPRALSLQF